jgi:hypothetical protein
MSDQMPPDEYVPPPEGPPSAALPPVPGGEAVPPPEAPPVRRKRGAIVAFVVALVLVVVGAAGALAYLKMRGAEGAVLDKVPVNADVVFVAHLDPAASQKANLFRMTEKFPDLGSREELAQRFNEMVDQALGGSGFSRDDLDWTGGEAGGFVDVGAGAPNYGAVIAVDDEGAANAALRTLRERETSTSGTTFSSTSISGVDVWVPSSSDQPTTAVFDGVAVAASDENTMRSMIDTANGASSVEDDAIFRGVMDRLPDDNLGFVFVNVHELLSLLDSIPPGLIPNMPSTAQFEGLEGIGFSVAAEPDGLAIDSVVTTDQSKLTQAQRDSLAAGDRPNPLLSLIPADAYAVIGASGAAGSQGVGPAGALNDALEQIARVDPSIAQGLRQLHLTDLLSHFTGDAAVQVAPGNGLLPVGGTVVLGIDDAHAVSAWLDRYVPVLVPRGPEGPRATLTSEEHDGVKITVLSGKSTSFREDSRSIPIAWAVLDNALVVGLSPADVAKVIDLAHGNGNAITADPGYTAAIADVPGTSSVLYLDVQAILSAVKDFLPADQYQAFLDQGGGDLQPIEAVVAGGTSDEQASTTRLLIKIP